MGWRFGVVVVWRATGAVALAILFAAGAQAAPVAQALRGIPSVETTRIIVDCSQRVSYGLAELASSPPQIAIDLHAVQLPRHGLRGLSFSKGPVHSVRALRTATGVRILIAAEDRAKVFAFPLPDPFRLVIDVKVPRPVRLPPAAAVREPLPPPSAGGLHGNRTEAQVRVPKVVPPVPSPRFKVVIDPGHGGRDPGARGVGGIWEKDVVLAISLRLAEKLRQTGEFDVALTRDHDVYLALEERTARANAEEADLFVSIHANASPNRAMSGVETYYLNNTNDRGTIRLARMENGLAAATDRKARHGNVAWILSDLVQSYKVDESVDLAHDLQQSTVETLRQSVPEVQDLGVKRGPFYVLVGAAMPSVLVEVSFLTNPVEGRRLARASYQDRIAEGLLRGLYRFAKNSVRPSTL